MHFLNLEFTIRMLALVSVSVQLQKITLLSSDPLFTWTLHSPEAVNSQETRQEKKETREEESRQ